VEGKVATELGMYNGEMPVAIPIGRMYCFHASIESKDEIIEVETKSETI
jgi:hypothetical protein